MEKEKSNGLLIIVLALIILCLGGYIVYDKVLNNTSNTSSQNEESNNANNNVSSYSYNLTKRTTIQEVGNGYIRVLVDTDGNAYLHTVGNLDYESDAKIKENVKAIENQFKTYSPKGYNSYGSTELKAYKLEMTNALTSYYVHQGNGGYTYFVFVKENGTLSCLSYDKLISNGEIELKNIDNVENAIAIVENEYSMNPYAITSDGNEIEFSCYK